MINEVFIKHLGVSIESWLNYTSAVGREFVLSESSIKLPLAEFVGTKIADTEAVKLEYLHPFFFMKRFDLYLERSVNNINYKSAFEFKYIKNASTLDKVEKQRILNDLLRLYFFKRYTKGSCKVYFLICGTQYEFDQSFQKIPTYVSSVQPRVNTPNTNIQTSGFYTEWFKFDYTNPEQLISLDKKNNPNYKPFYNDFFKKYGKSYERQMGKGNKLDKVKEFKTNLIFLSQDNNQKDVPESMKLGVWEIL